MSRLFQWLPSRYRQYFCLSPLSVFEHQEIIKKRTDRMVLIAAFDGEAIVKYGSGYVDRIMNQAEGLAKYTKNPVCVGRQIGVDSNGMPVWESIGRVLTRKADPLSPEAFDSWALNMARKVLAVSANDLQNMSREALEYLAIDFVDATTEQIERALAGYSTTIATPSARMMNAQRLSITRSLQPILRRVSMGAARLPEVQAGLGTGLAIRDKKISRLLTSHHTFWVRDRHGAISQDLSARAREIISSGVERGLGRADIARELRVLTADGLTQPGYWQAVSSVHVGRARSYALGATYRSAGIEYFRIEAVLDDRTTHQCEFLHGKILPVSDVMASVDRTLNSDDPEAVLWNQPFIKDRGDRLEIEYPDGSVIRVADIDRRATGAHPGGITAEFSNALPPGEMVDAGIGLPPYHFGCRTTTVPA